MQDMTGTGADTGRSPAEELKAAMAGFAQDFKTFSTDIHLKLQEQDTRMSKLSAKMIQRPALAAAAETGTPHGQAFEAYVRSGDDDGLRGLVLEGKALSMQVNSDGGYLVDPETAAAVRSTLLATASLRKVAQVVQVNATAYDVLIDHSEAGAAWATETGAVTESGTPLIDRISIPLFELSAMPKASQRLLDDSAFDIEGWLAGRIAAKFARAEAEAFINGDGADKPRGILDYPTVDNAVWTWDALGTVKTGSDGGFHPSAPASALIDLVYALPAEYRANAHFVMNSRTASAIRKIKDGEGRFLWSDSYAEGEPSRLLGHAVLIAEDMPDIAPGAKAVAFGDFAQGYTIAERPDLRILRDPFSAKPHVLFYATKRVGGGVSDFQAIKLLDFSA